MRLLTISYSESKETVNSYGLKEWKKIGVEMEVEENDNYQDAFLNARNHVQQWHKESNPTQYFEQSEQLPIIQEKER